MTRLKHTPGPWEAHDNGLIYGPPVDDSDEAAFVADAIADEGARIFGFLSDTEMANAHLIVAAPELLEALDLCVEVLGELARLDDGTASVSALHMASAALAKARPA